MDKLPQLTDEKVAINLMLSSYTEEDDDNRCDGNVSLSMNHREYAYCN